MMEDNGLRLDILRDIRNALKWGGSGRIPKNEIIKKYSSYSIEGEIQTLEKLGFIKVTEEKYIRAAHGGVGEAKTAGNYAAAMYPTLEAQKGGYDQIMWLDAVEFKYIQEVGTMNIFFVIDDEIVTPELNGSILPGVTRMSVIELAKHWGENVSERKVSIDELFEAHAAGRLKEVFGSGTAAVISPVGQIKYGDDVITINDNQTGPVAQKLYNAITDIQYGKAEDPLGWVVPVV